MTKVYSVVIPAYNAKKTIEACLASVAKQTLSPLEVLVIDDHSTDGTEEVVRQCKVIFEKTGINLEYIFLSQNSGPSVARNKGINKSKGDFIAFLDADDVWVRNKLEEVNKFSNLDNLGVICHSYVEIKQVYLDIRFDLYRAEVISIHQLLIRNIAQTSCVVVRKQSGLLFNESMRYCEDYDFLMRVAENFKIVRLVGKPLTILSRPQLTAGGLSGNKIRMRIGEVNVYYKFCSRNWPMRFWILPILLTFSILKHLYSSVRRWA